MADEPVATGTLAKTPLAHLLIYLDQKQLSGTLALWPDVVNDADRKQDRILFLKGRPVAGRLMEPARTLREGLLKLFYRSEAPYAFYESNLLGSAEERLNGRVDPLSLITESLRSTARDSVVEDVLARVGRLRLRVQPKVELTRFEFVPEERALVDLVLAEPSTVAQLQQDSSLPSARARRLVYLLLISKSVQPYDEAFTESTTGTYSGAQVRESLPSKLADGAAAPRTSMRAPSTAPAAGPSKSPAARLDRLADIPEIPANLTPELLERWQRIVSRARSIENQTYFEMLGLDKNAGSGEAKAEYFKLAKDFHPDRLPSELAALRGCVEVIFGYLNEAHKTLGDDETRAAYLRSVREGGGTPATERLMQQILDSAIAYERVQVFARKHQYDEALEVIQKILVTTKDEPDYYAMYAHLLMGKHPGHPGSEAPTVKIMEALDRAIELHGDHEKAHLYKGKMLQRMGQKAEALRHFKKVVALNPNNVDAAREVRVASMREDRQDKNVGRTTAAGFFNKLIKGDKPAPEEEKEKGSRKKR